MTDHKNQRIEDFKIRIIYVRTKTRKTSDFFSSRLFDDELFVRIRWPIAAAYLSSTLSQKQVVIVVKKVHAKNPSTQLHAQLGRQQHLYWESNGPSRG